MKKLIKVAIVGRPNVGKSRLFNRILKKNIAIVDEEEGTTRDRQYGEADLFGFPFTIIDTAGLDFHSKAPFQEEMRRQAEIAMEEADAVILVVDRTCDLTSLDLEVARLLRKKKKPLVLAVNKCDSDEQDGQIYAFKPLGISSIIPISALQNRNIAELLEEALSSFSKEGPFEKKESSTSIAIVGRPNVGKSSLINALLQDSRLAVSPLAGTTRDAIDTPFTCDGKNYTLIDTAGIRKRNKEKEVVEKFSHIRTTKAMERAKIVILMIDAEQGMTTQEKRIASDIEDLGKGCLIMINKWDLVKGFRMETCLRSLHEASPFLSHCPHLFISAKTGRNLEKIIPLIDQIEENSLLRITTGQLNKFIEECLQRNHPTMVRGKRLRLYYMAQIDVSPPTFVLFVNHPSLMDASYQKYLINQFRNKWKFTGVPLRFYLRGRRTKEAEGKPAEEEEILFDESHDSEEI